MKPVYAILLTVVLWVACLTLCLLGLGLFPSVLLNLFLSIWVYLDARELGMKRYKLGLGPTGPLSSAILVLLLWVVFFPWYLINKDRVLHMKEQRMEDDYPTPVQLTETDVTTLETLHNLRKSDALTESEYTVEKSRILHLIRRNN